MNKNDTPLTELNEREKSITTNKIDYFNEFRKICSLSPNLEKEKIDIIDIIDTISFSKKGFVYCLVIDGVVLKIGSSITDINKRIQSYNCGKKAYRKNGTCSTTNYFVLQTILNINMVVDLYAFFPEVITIDVFGDQEEVSLPAKNYEKKILSNLKKAGNFPALCTQT